MEILFVAIILAVSAPLLRRMWEWIAAYLQVSSLRRSMSELLGTCRAEVKTQTTKHKEILLRKRRQMLSIDDYGVVQKERWEKEKSYFIRQVVFGGAPPFEALDDASEAVEYAAGRDPEFSLGTEEELTSYVDQILDSFAADETAYIFSQLPEDSGEFEFFCADLLRTAGWATRVTKATGDQGADVIASLGDEKAVFQCKLYSSPVGNKAVQEVVAAKAVHGARFGCVVSNQSYTKPAQQLAEANGVLLLHFGDLGQLAHRLGIQNSVSSSVSTVAPPAPPRGIAPGSDERGGSKSSYYRNAVYLVGLLVLLLVAFHLIGHSWEHWRQSMVSTASQRMQPNYRVPVNKGGDPNYYYDATPAGMGPPLTDPAYQYNWRGPPPPPSGDTFPSHFANYEAYLAWARSQAEAASPGAGSHTKAERRRD